MKYKIGDCFYVPDADVFVHVSNIAHEQYYFVLNDLLVLNVYENLLLTYISQNRIIPLKEDTEKERLAIILKYAK